MLTLIQNLERNRNVSLLINKCCDSVDKKWTCSKFIEIHFTLYSYEMNSEIIFSNYLTKLNLSKSNMYYISDIFSKLVNLKECILSQNNIRIISECISNLLFLHTLRLDSNKIEYLPAFLNDMPSLFQLDVYDNEIEIVYCNLESINCLDIAMNCIDEPDTHTYQVQKKKIRDSLNHSRLDRSKSWLDYISDENEDSGSFEDDENYYTSSHNDNTTIVTEDFECWDSDEYWTPSSVVVPKPHYSKVFDNFAARLMKQGHFCPMDAHVQAVPKFEHIVDYELGQFDDA